MTEAVLYGVEEGGEHLPVPGAHGGLLRPPRASSLRGCRTGHARCSTSRRCSRSHYDGYPGVVEICHRGCAIYDYLVVNGAAYGTIWIGAEGEIRPTGLSFGAWYRRWAEKALRTLGNEHLVRRLRVGMTKAEVTTVVGGEWKARKALGRPIWYFEAPEIAAQIELDEHGVVVAVRPWRFISAAP